MGPEVGRGLVLRDPELGHVGQQVGFAKGRQEGRDRGPRVGRDVAGVAGGDGVVLAAGLVGGLDVWIVVYSRGGLLCV